MFLALTPGNEDAIARHTYMYCTHRAVLFGWSQIWLDTCIYNPIVVRQCKIAIEMITSIIYLFKNTRVQCQHPTEGSLIT